MDINQDLPDDIYLSIFQFCDRATLQVLSQMAEFKHLVQSDPRARILLGHGLDRCPTTSIAGNQLLYFLTCADDRSSLNYVRQHGLDWHPLMPQAAIMASRPATLQYLLEENCPSPGLTDLICLAINYGEMECLQYLLAQPGCVLCGAYMRMAAKHDRLDMMQLLYEKHCPWHPATCGYATTHRCLIWAHQHGAPINESLLREACRRGDVESLRYLYFQWCVYPPFTEYLPSCHRKTYPVLLELIHAFPRGIHDVIALRSAWSFFPWMSSLLRHKLALLPPGS